MGKEDRKIRNYQRDVVTPLLTKLAKEFFISIEFLEEKQGDTALAFLNIKNQQWIDFCRKKEHPYGAVINENSLLEVVDKIFINNGAESVKA